MIKILIFIFSIFYIGIANSIIPPDFIGGPPTAPVVYPKWHLYHQVKSPWSPVGVYTDWADYIEISPDGNYAIVAEKLANVMSGNTTYISAGRIFLYHKENL